MSFLKIENVRISGISACVPESVESTIGSQSFPSSDDAAKFISTTGIFQRRIAPPEICSSDLCFHAASKLLDDLGWIRSEIDCLIFITQTPDYIVPATACILQHRLGLSTDCYSFDITLGCSGWVYGVSVISSLLSSGHFKKGLLLVGETTTKTKSKADKSTYPLFGDAGTATCLEYCKDSDPMFFHMGTDGSKHKAIYIPDGAFRNPTTDKSLEMTEIEPGVRRNRLQYIMDGGAVFIFSITQAPKSIKSLLEKAEINKDEIDYFFLHQANKIMVDKILGKIQVPVEKAPCSYDTFGNTSMSSIPLTMVLHRRTELKEGKLKLLACGFGSGLSWASGYFVTDHIVCPELIEI